MGVLAITVKAVLGELAAAVATEVAVLLGLQTQMVAVVAVVL
jgi:hypothetical protein